MTVTNMWGDSIFRLRPGIINNDYINLVNSLMSEDAEANKKAETLFLANLTPEQLKTHENYRYITVKGNSTGRIYKIFTSGSRTNNVETERRYLCFGPRDVPLYDFYLAQKVALECFENEALKVANVTPRLWWENCGATQSQT